jgi:16S rRNA (guanine966-N2)-methyltransferase
MGTRRGTVRLIGGEHGGRKLHFQDRYGEVRPTSDRLRETLFNWLQFELPGARVLDLFAGSGALGAEALSRGAEQAVLIERARALCVDLEKQLKPLFEERLDIVHGDALDWLARHDGVFDLVFVDPPYDLKLQAKACNALESGGFLAEGALIYVESDLHAPAPAVPANWAVEREKSGGDVRALLYRRNRPGGESGA